MSLPYINRDRAPEPEPRTATAAYRVLAVLAVVLFLKYAQELLIPVVLSLLVACAVNPLVVLLERARIPRTIAAALAVVSVWAAIGVGSYSLRGQVKGALDSVPGAVAKLRGELQKYRQTGAVSGTSIGKIQQTAKEIEQTAAVAAGAPEPNAPPKVTVEQPAFRLTDLVRMGSMEMMALVSNAVVITFLVFFLLIYGDLFKRKIVRLVGSRLSEKKLTVETLNQITAQVDRFLLIQVLASIGVAFCMAAALWMFGLHEPAFWGLTAGVMCFVPYLGPVFTGIALMLAAFVQFDSLAASGEVGVIALVIFSLEGFLVKPAVMGRAANVNGVAMFLGFLFWGWIWGLIGVVVAVPIMIVAKLVCERIESLHPIAALLDES